MKDIPRTWSFNLRNALPSCMELQSSLIWCLRKISLVLINISTQLSRVKNDHVGIFWFQLTLTGSRSFGTHFVLSISSPASVLLVIHIKLSKIVQETAKYALFFMSTWNNKSFTGKFVLYGLFVICVSDRYPFLRSLQVPAHEQRPDHRWPNKASFNRFSCVEERPERVS